MLITKGMICGFLRMVLSSARSIRDCSQIEYAGMVIFRNTTEVSLQLPPLQDCPVTKVTIV